MSNNYYKKSTRVKAHTRRDPRINKRVSVNSYTRNQRYRSYKGVPRNNPITKSYHAPKEPVKYINTVDVAKLIRKELKEKYPDTKFRVTSKKYSGGSSIDVKWIDGPSQETVNKVIQKFAGAGFDSYQDIKTYKGAVDYEGEKVKFGVDYVFAKRDYSEDTWVRTANEVAQKWDVNKRFKSMNEVKSSSFRVKNAGDEYFTTLVYRELYKKKL